MRPENKRTIGGTVAAVGLAATWGFLVETFHRVGAYPNHAWQDIGVMMLLAGGLALVIVSRTMSDYEYKTMEIAAVLAWTIFGISYAAATFPITYLNIVAGLTTGLMAGVTFVVGMWMLLWIDSKAGRYFNVRFWRLT